MPLDEKDQETKKWLEIAMSDLGAGQKLSANEDFSSQAAFFAQQAAEKALKGFLVWHQERFKKEHDIRYLGNLVLKKDATLKAILDEAATLTPFAVTFRYPGEDGPALEAVKEALETATKLVNEIVARLPKTAQP